MSPVNAESQVHAAVSPMHAAVSKVHAVSQVQQHLENSRVGAFELHNAPVRY
jgi:hypothetical protein